jgi:hypothetical protein
VSLGVSRFARAALVAAAAILALVFAGDAVACVCRSATMKARLDSADAAVVGHVVATRRTELRGEPQLLLTIDVEQRVKGRGLDDPILVRTPLHTDCDVRVPPNRTVGWLLTKAPDGALLATACSVVGAAPLVEAGGEPRGGVIKVGVGLVILALVLLWAFRRLRRGTRPRLPGAPTQ